MKKIVMSILLLLLLFISGCGYNRLTSVHRSEIADLDNYIIEVSTTFETDTEETTKLQYIYIDQVNDMICYSDLLVEDLEEFGSDHYVLIDESCFIVYEQSSINDYGYTFDHDNLLIYRFDAGYNDNIMVDFYGRLVTPDLEDIKMNNTITIESRLGNFLEKLLYDTPEMYASHEAVTLTVDYDPELEIFNHALVDHTIAYNELMNNEYISVITEISIIDTNKAFEVALPNYEVIIDDHPNTRRQCNYFGCDSFSAQRTEIEGNVTIDDIDLFKVSGSNQGPDLGPVNFELIQITEGTEILVEIYDYENILIDSHIMNEANYLTENINWNRDTYYLKITTNDDSVDYVLKYQYHGTE